MRQPSTSRAKKARPRKRFSPDARKKQIVAVAARLLTRHGTDLAFSDLAAAAGVTRPVIYKFFPTRRALVAAVLEDFEAALRARFVEGATASLPGNLEEITRVFVDAVCDTIEAKGAGPWKLLDTDGPDPEIARMGRAIQERIVAPWRPRIAEITGASPREVLGASRMIVAAGRAVLELWYSGSLTREEAAEAATRGVSALLREFTHDAPTARAPRRR